MTFRRFTEIWTYRYRKFSHIARAYLSAYCHWVRLIGKKNSFGKKKELIAIVRTEHFGDIVAAEPIAREVRRQFPNAYILWFVKPAFRQLIDSNPSIDETFCEFCVTERRALFKTGIFDHVFELQFRNNNHCSICETYSENPVALAAGINVHTYFNFGNLLKVFSLSAALPLPVDDSPRVYISESERNKVDLLNLDQPFIVIHTSSNYPPKDWPAANWERLVHLILTNSPYSIIEIGLRSSLTINESGYRNLSGQLDLLQTAEVIRRSVFFIGLDSGPAHFANATGTFGFIIMGALGDFPSYNPYSGSYGKGENCVLLREEGVLCADLPFEKVADTVLNLLPTFS